MPNDAREIAQAILSRIPADAGRVPASTLLNSESVPPVVRGFLQLQFEIAVSADLAPLQSHFQLAQELHESLHETFLLGLASQSTLAHEDALSLLTRAVEDAIEYLTQPQSFLLTFLTNGAASFTLDDRFFRSLDYIHAYSYFPEILTYWAERAHAEGIEQLESKQLKQTLRNIDRAVTGNYAIEQVEDLLRPLFELFDAPTLPKAYLSRLFFDKGAQLVVMALRDDPRTELTLQETVDFLAVLLHRAADLRPTETVRPEPSENYSQFLEELRQAGVVLDSAPEQSYLRAIESRAASENRAHEN
jgi:hypothetical protein